MPSSIQIDIARDALKTIDGLIASDVPIYQLKPALKAVADALDALEAEPVIGAAIKSEAKKVEKLVKSDAEKIKADAAKVEDKLTGAKSTAHAPTVEAAPEAPAAK